MIAGDCLGLGLSRGYTKKKKISWKKSLRMFSDVKSM